MSENLLRLRRQRGLTAAELSRRLASLGQPIIETGIIKIEKGDRRVDVDDLVALAAALDVSPSELLLPEWKYGTAASTVAVTSHQDASVREMWAWATGEVPLGRRPVSISDPREAREDEWNFAVLGRPHHFAGSSYIGPLENALMSDAVRSRTPAALGALVIAAFQAGASTADIRDIVETALVSAMGSTPDEFSAEWKSIIEGFLRSLEDEVQQ
ncbi:MAG TPA: helix-turn-helix transcriptional regulator [Streptosporangiaceae bacterium]|nr:helix-turn-helix transcriptional regulator [Streptosporangiaceae bacterium]